MAIIKQLYNKANINVSYWNIAYIEIINGKETRVRLNGYLNKESRNNGAERVEEKHLSFETTKEDKFNFNEIYKLIKTAPEFEDAQDDI